MDLGRSHLAEAGTGFLVAAYPVPDILPAADPGTHPAEVADHTVLVVEAGRTVLAVADHTVPEAVDRNLAAEADHTGLEEVLHNHLVEEAGRTVLLAERHIAGLVAHRTVGLGGADRPDRPASRLCGRMMRRSRRGGA